MLGLPSTTEVSVRLPKKAFYRNMDLDSRTHAEFVSDVGGITVVNSVKPTTANVADGRHVHEILVMEVETKGRWLSDRVLRVIDQANECRKVFTFPSSRGIALVFDGRIDRVIDGERELEIRGRDLDEVWESFLSQILFDDPDGTDVEGRIERDCRARELEREIDAFDRKVRAERQYSRKNELYDQLRGKRQELVALKEDK